MKNKEIKKLSDQVIDSHGLPKVDVPEPVFTTINGALNYWNNHTMEYKKRGMTIDEVKSILLKILVRYKYSDDVKDL